MEHLLLPWIASLATWLLPESDLQFLRSGDSLCAQHYHEPKQMHNFSTWAAHPQLHPHFSLLDVVLIDETSMSSVMPITLLSSFRSKSTTSHSCEHCKRQKRNGCHPTRFHQRSLWCKKNNNDVSRQHRRMVQDHWCTCDHSMIIRWINLITKRII
jgi:hypothetical protein